jgi:hypothetical protein
MFPNQKSFEIKKRKLFSNKIANKISIQITIKKDKYFANKKSPKTTHPREIQPTQKKITLNSRKWRLPQSIQKLPKKSSEKDEKSWGEGRQPRKYRNYIWEIKFAGCKDPFICFMWRFAIWNFDWNTISIETHRNRNPPRSGLKCYQLWTVYLRKNSWVDVVTNKHLSRLTRIFTFNFYLENIWRGYDIWIV